MTKLAKRNKTFTQRIHRAGFRNVADAHGTTLFQKKKKAEARLNSTKKRLRVQMIAQARKRHFRTADTHALDAQFSTAAVSCTSTQEPQPAELIVYNIPERAKVVQLVCSSGKSLSDGARFQRRIQAIEARTALCNRREAQRCGRPKVTIERELDSTADGYDADAKAFPMVCRPTQCPFCLGKESLPYHHRVYEYAKPHQMMNEVDKHLKNFAPTDKVPFPHPQCKAAGLVLSSVMHYKSHTATVHKIFLRG